tara:strand:- start:540 stop:722 length:183 start_codon:yes stop_codon:yes gene_type:complete
MRKRGKKVLNNPLLTPIILVLLGILTYFRIINFVLFVSLVMIIFMVLLYNLNKGTRDFDD